MNKYEQLIEELTNKALEGVDHDEDIHYMFIHEKYVELSEDGTKVTMTDRIKYQVNDKFSLRVILLFSDGILNSEDKYTFVDNRIPSFVKDFRDVFLTKYNKQKEV